MKVISTHINNLKRRSIWIISSYVITNLLSFITGVYLDGVVDKPVYRTLKFSFGVILLGIVILSLINSVLLIRKADTKNNIKWLIISAIPFLLFLVGLTIVLSVGDLSNLRF